MNTISEEKIKELLNSNVQDDARLGAELLWIYVNKDIVQLDKFLKNLRSSQMILRNNHFIHTIDEQVKIYIGYGLIDIEEIL